MNTIQLNNKIRRFFSRIGGGGVKALQFKKLDISGNGDSGGDESGDDYPTEEIRQYAEYLKIGSYGQDNPDIIWEEWEGKYYIEDIEHHWTPGIPHIMLDPLYFENTNVHNVTSTSNLTGFEWITGEVHTNAISSIYDDDENLISLSDFLNANYPYVRIGDMILKRNTGGGDYPQETHQVFYSYDGGTQLDLNGTTSNSYRVSALDVLEVIQ